MCRMKSWCGFEPLFTPHPNIRSKRNIEGFAGWRRAVDDHDAYDELVLWFEHDLFDQLNLIHLLSYLGRRHALLKPVSLVTLDRFPGIADFKGLGQLHARRHRGAVRKPPTRDRASDRVGEAGVDGVSRLRPAID